MNMGLHGEWEGRTAGWTTSRDGAYSSPSSVSKCSWWPWALPRLREATFECTHHSQPTMSWKVMEGHGRGRCGEIGHLRVHPPLATNNVIGVPSRQRTQHRGEALDAIRRRARHVVPATCRRAERNGSRVRALPRVTLHRRGQWKQGGASTTTAFNAAADRTRRRSSRARRSCSPPKMAT